MKVLVADDDMVARSIYRAALEKDGFEVIETEDGDQALAIMQESSIRLVVADWEMPGLSGLELVAKAREAANDGYTYIIVATGRGQRADMVAMLEAGADDYLSKPIDPVELALRVRAGARIIGLESRELVIFAMARLAETRDLETGQHLERTRLYCRMLAEGLRRRNLFPDEITPAFISLIHECSPLHDIGKIAIPDAILLKPGKLTDEEFNIMKSHTTLGARTLGDALAEFPEAGFLQMAHDIALCHHEKWDGSGYPRGIEGDEIPLAARIMSIADVYDALVSERVYKDAMTHEEAVQLIADGADAHFDPTIVATFIEDNAMYDEARRSITDPRDTDRTDFDRRAA